MIIHEMSLKSVSGNIKYKAYYASFVLCVLLLVKNVVAFFDSLNIFALR